MDDSQTPTTERIAKGDTRETGHRTSRRFVADDALARAWVRGKVSGEEYSALRRYALHWLAGGLQGHLGTLDLDRVFAHDPTGMSGLTKTERQQDHRDAYREAKIQIGLRPAFVADHVACFGSTLCDVGIMLGYRSAAHARLEAGLILADAGYRLGAIWKDRDR